MDDISVVLSGEAGMGIQTVEKLLTRLLKENNLNCYATKEYMSRVRGGNNSTEIRVGSGRVRGYKHHIDMLLPLGKNAMTRHLNRINDKTVILGEKESFDEETEATESPIALTEIAKNAGNKLFTNTAAVGAICAVLNLDLDSNAKLIYDTFLPKGEKIAEGNKNAFEKGYEEAATFEKIAIEPHGNQIQDEILINGADSIALGAIAGGANFVSSYPMSPSTTVLVALAQRAGDYGLVLEQAEDEISAINMACGASFAGAKPFVTTSGGGLALMGEGISLAGIIEAPVVIHVAQRPGPATGLPTRTEQGDLNLVLYAGHGDFPKAVFAPGTVDSAFHIAGRAMRIAEQYQTTAFILSDQYFVDTYYNVPRFSPDKTNEAFLIKSTRDYQRYKLTKDGISPKAIPGYGDGVVKADSDEHDEMGHITESFDVRNQMVDKRMKKAARLKEDLLDPLVRNDKEGKTLIISWGSTYHTIDEALDSVDHKELSHMHFEQVYPLPGNLGETLKQYEQVVFVENNVTGQFSELVKKETGFTDFKRITKHSGIQFSIEELTASFKKLNKGGV